VATNDDEAVLDILMPPIRGAVSTARFLLGDEAPAQARADRAMAILLANPTTRRRIERIAVDEIAAGGGPTGTGAAGADG
jgi:hypothetical protein